MASPVPPASSRSPMPPSPASPSCRSTLLSGLMGGLCVGAVAAVVLFICCRIKKGQPRAPTSGAPTSGVPQTFDIRRFTLDQVKEFTKNFLKEIGGGGFGRVYEGSLPNGEGGSYKVAVKRLNRESQQGEPEFKTEVENLSRSHHKHVVSLVGYCIEEQERVLVYEFVPNKTIEFHLHGNEQTLEWTNRWKIALGSAKGLAYLHEYCNPRIIHRDIKANNILLGGDYEAKIADFGLAKCIPESKTHVTTNVKGTTGYIDPEYRQSYQNQYPLTEKTDIYSFGMVLLELITGRKPTEPIEGFQGGLYDWVWSQLPRYMEDGNFDSLVDPRLKNVNREEMARMVRCAVACVYQISKKRPTMSEIVRALEGHPDLPFSPTHLFREGSGPSSDRGTSQGVELSGKTPLGNQKNGSSHHREPTPGSRGAGPSRPTAQGVEMRKM